jgi:hypothetical protein
MPLPLTVVCSVQSFPKGTYFNDRRNSLFLLIEPVQFAFFYICGIFWGKIGEFGQIRTKSFSLALLPNRAVLDKSKGKISMPHHTPLLSAPTLHSASQIGVCTIFIDLWRGFRHLN